MIMKAKKGDRVRALASSGGGFIEGNIYTLREDFEGTHEYDTVMVESDERGSTSNGWRQKFFEPADQPQSPLFRAFSTGATRDTDENKLDFEGFLSPLVLEAFAKYMHGKRKMPDGSMRDSDNWQKGMGHSVYLKSMFRHFFAVWKSHRAGKVSEEDLLALFFNVQGLAHEVLIGRNVDGAA